MDWCAILILHSMFAVYNQNKGKNCRGLKEGELDYWYFPINLN